MRIGSRNFMMALGAIAAGGAAIVLAVRRYGSGNAAEAPGSEGHVPTDLLKGEPVGLHDRAIEAFRPDPLALPTPEEREALRPATGPAPSLVNNEGTVAATSGA